MKMLRCRTSSCWLILETMSGVLPAKKKVTWGDTLRKEECYRSLYHLCLPDFFYGDLEVELCPKIPSFSWFELIFNDNVHLLSSVKTSHVRGHFNNGKELNEYNSLSVDV